MPFISREQFLKQQKEREERVVNYQNQGPFVGYFGLKDDGDEAVVRFIYSDPEELYDNSILFTHSVTIDGKFRKVACLRSDFNEPIENCPLCASGNSISQKVYLKLIQYDRDEQGNIVANPKIWERPVSYIDLLIGKMEEYGPLCDTVFKIKRHGAKGDTKTTYDIMFANPKIYNDELYPKDFSAFDNYSVLGTAILDKNAEEMKELIGVGPDTRPTESATSNTPQVTTTPRKVTY